MSNPAPTRARLRLRIVVAVVAAALLGGACSAGGSPAPESPSVVVTTAVLGSVVGELVGDAAAVTVLMANGVDPHEWSPSAKEIERVMKADLVVANGLGLEEGLEKALVEAEKAGVAVFRATDHIQVREVTGEGDDHGAGDPHFWVDPISMQDVVRALAEALAPAGVDVADRGADLEQRLADLDAETRATLAVVPDAARTLVTGHESMGYFADRYGFELIGTVIPGLSSQGEVSAGELAALKAQIVAEVVCVLFTEIGTPVAVVAAIAKETGAAVVELPSHTIPDDGSYFSFIREIASAVADALR
jgi:zinc/manganese transport system substrate-binding protein